MILRKFQDAYQDAVNELPTCHIDVEQVLDEAHHAEFAVLSEKKQIRYKKLTRIAAVAAGLFVVCGVGTVTAMNYQKSIIRIEDTGYSITSRKSAEADGTMAGNDDGIEAVSDGEKEEAYRKYIQEITSEAMEEDTQAAAEELEVMVAEIVEPKVYTSIEEFRAKEALTVAIPELELLGEEFEEQSITVMDEGRQFSLLLYSQERRFGLQQLDTRNYMQYASSTTYTGESVNERSFVNDQGLSYVVFDTMEEDVIVSTHAIISVNGRDLCMDFYGYEKNVIEDVLKQLDLSIYFQD